MAREGTRSATGNSKPRVFPVVDTAPTITRKKATKPKKPAVAAAADTTKAKAPATTKGAKPTGVTKKAAPKKESTVAKKVKTAPKKAEDKIDKAVKDTKAKTSTKKKEPVVKAA